MKIISRGRKRKIIFEKTKINNQISSTFLLHHEYFNTSFLKSNNFEILLSNNDGLHISPNSIQRYYIEEEYNEKTLKICSLLEIGDWFENFSKMEICQINFFDSFGNVFKELDFDISYIGYKISGDYQSESFAEKVFKYKILL